jgi:hypothetical protein
MFLNHSMAFDWFIRLFPNNVDHIDYRNHKRHLVLYLKDGRRYYVLFKHEMIHSFNYLAKSLIDKYPDLQGYGESINVEFCMLAKNKGCQLVYIYEDGKVYEINPRTVQAISIVREQNKENSYIEHGLAIVKNEREHIFPVKILQPMILVKEVLA